jgi:hypothetical protein
MSKMGGSKGFETLLQFYDSSQSSFQKCLKITRTPQKSTMWIENDRENAFFILHHFVSQKNILDIYFRIVIRPQDRQNAFSSGLRMSHFWTLKIMGSCFLFKNAFMTIIERIDFFDFFWKTFLRKSKLDILKMSKMKNPKKVFKKREFYRFYKNLYIFFIFLFL